MLTEPFTNDEGHRDYRSRVTAAHRTRPRWAFMLGCFFGTKWPWLVLMAFILGFFFGTKAHGADCVQLQVRPQTMLMPSDIRVETRVCRQANHRELVLSWDSDRGGAGSSRYPLEGEASPALFTRWLPHQPPANYLFQADVLDQRGMVVDRDRQRIVSVAE